MTTPKKGIERDRGREKRERERERLREREWVRGLEGQKWPSISHQVFEKMMKEFPVFDFFTTF